jgi:hypothetical protein
MPTIYDPVSGLKNPWTQEAPLSNSDVFMLDMTVYTVCSPLLSSPGSYPVAMTHSDVIGMPSWVTSLRTNSQTAL